MPTTNPEEDQRQLALLTTPLGAAGSGRIRYAAAMHFNRQGQLSDAVLEAYRTAAAADAQDPRHVLAERGLTGALPTLAPLTAEAIAAGTITTLLDAADRYLATLPGPGVAESRAGIAAARHGPVTLQPQPHPVGDAHLSAALDLLDRTHPDLAHAIAAAAPHLNWAPFDGCPRDQIGPDFLQNHAAASVLGQDAPIAALDFDVGLFLIAPHILYRDHHHAAPELYAPLTGPHGWRFGPGTPLTIKPAHHPVWNPPHRPHLTKVGPIPFLCLYVWTRDVTEPAHVIPAGDWPALAALRLGP